MNIGIYIGFSRVDTGIKVPMRFHGVVHKWNQVFNLWKKYFINKLMIFAFSGMNPCLELPRYLVTREVDAPVNTMHMTPALLLSMHECVQCAFCLMNFSPTALDN